MKFKPTSDGFVSAIKFYRTPADTSTATKVQLWTSTGTLLGAGSFSGLAVAGWNTINLSTPIKVAANTLYVVSYFSPTGYYSDTKLFFNSQVVSGPITAVQNVDAQGDGVNGVYTYGTTPIFPSSSYYAGNYWVDVVYYAGENPLLATTQNYIITNTVKQSGVTTMDAVTGLAIATQGKMQTIDYIDGLARPLQNIATNASATGHDLVTGIEYDSLGREVKKYLPYSDVGNTVIQGGYRPGWKPVQSTFYSGGYMINVDTSTSPYSLSVIEPSPLNRVAAQGAPGATWQPNTANPYDATKHVVQMQYLANVTGDSIRYFTINSSATISSSGYYAAGTINIKVTTDEQQQTVKEYTDLFGHVILKRVLIASDSLQTYYIYDSLNNLRAVIQPEGLVALKQNAWAFPTGFSSNWMFLYRYDERKRMVMKKLPGADSVNMLYDQWDRLVLTQDGNLRTSHFWIFTKYDQLNRAVLTGQITDSRSLSLVQTDVTNSTGKFESVSTSATEGYTLNNTFPSSGSYTLTVYTTTHYDSYANLPTAWASSYSFVNEDGVATQNTFMNGQVIATQTRVLGTSTFYRTVTYYDDRYRVIQITSDNATGKKDRITKLLSFDGKPTSDYHTHLSNFFTTALVTQRVYTYDPVDRLLTVTHQTGTQEVVTINQSAYTETGQLFNKRIHQSPSHPNPLQKLDYYYNIRGWLNSVNRPLLSEVGYEENDLFNEELHYQTSVMPSSTTQFNGNITEEIWKNGYDESEQGYTYQYDKANRLKSANYGYDATNGGASWNSSKVYNESSIAYDHNGNITTLSRSLNGFNTIDSLGYKNYVGNQLGRVDDYAAAVPQAGFQDKTSGTGYDYTYDMNGNTISDYNKSISSITYNYLNLPSVVTFTSKGTITYSYDAAGNKLQKTTLDQTVTPNKTTTYTYAGDYVYRNGGTVDTLEFASMPEGRLRPVRIDTTQAISMTNLKYIYDYFIKDHLGSVRSVLTTEQETDKYAATMETANATVENALFYNVSATGTTVPSGFTNDPNNKMASKLNGNINTGGNKRVGPSIILKVMTGDTISISTYGWYQGAVQPLATGVTPIANDLLPILTAGIGGANGGKGGAVPTSFSGSLIGNAVLAITKLDSLSDSTTRPKAFLNWMVVGEDYAAATGSTNHVGAMQIPICNSGDTMKQMTGLNRLVCRRNGWIYVYVSNETAQDVYFDNLVINLTHGPLVEQKDYYAFGMQNPALSTQAIKYLYKNNRYTYTGKELQSQEFVDSSGLNEYDLGARFYDPQIGRWNVNDPLSEKIRRFSLYAYCFDNSIRYIDPDGMEGETYDEYGQTAQKPWDQQSHGSIDYYVDGSKVSEDAAVSYMLKNGAVDAQSNTAGPTDPPGVNYSTYDASKDGDQKGLLRNATQIEWQANPVRASIKDLGHAIYSFVGLNTLDDNIADVAQDYHNGTLTIGKFLTAGLNVTMVMMTGDEGGVIPDEANVVRGGLNKPENMVPKDHPSGVTGFSANCGTCSVKELSSNLPHNQVGSTTAGRIRAAGGDVIRTSGGAQYHSTVTGLSSQEFADLLDITKNPNR